jgi:DNA-binding transcriptional ArsR family regulator
VAAEFNHRLTRTWLKKKGHICFKDISIAGKFPDIICLKGNEVVAIEIKNNILEITKAIGQVLHYMQKANRVYIALPSKDVGFVPAETLKTLKATGIGLMSAGPTVKITLEARKTTKNNADLIKELRKMTVKEPQPLKNGDEEAKRESIIELLRQYPEGLSILDISKHIGTTRQTASRYVLALISEGIVKIRKVGPAKLCYLKRWGRKNAKK